MAATAALFVFALPGMAQAHEFAVKAGGKILDAYARKDTPGGAFEAIRLAASKADPAWYQTSPLHGPFWKAFHHWFSGSLRPRAGKTYLIGRLPSGVPAHVQDAINKLSVHEHVHHHLAKTMVAPRHPVSAPTPLSHMPAASPLPATPTPQIPSLATPAATPSATPAAASLPTATPTHAATISPGDAPAGHAVQLWHDLLVFGHAHPVVLLGAAVVLGVLIGVPVYAVYQWRQARRAERAAAARVGELERQLAQRQQPVVTARQEGRDEARAVLGPRIADLERSLERMERSAQEASQEADRLRRQITEAAARNLALQSELGQKRARINELETALAESERASAEQLRLIQELKGRMVAMETELAGTKQQLAEASLSQAQESATAQAAITGLNQQMERLQTQIDELNEKKEALEAELAGAQGELQRAQGAAERKSTEIADVNRQLEDLKSRSAELQVSLEQQKRKCLDLETQISVLQEQITKQRERTRQHRARTAALLGRLRKRLQDYQRQMSQTEKGQETKMLAQAQRELEQEKARAVLLSEALTETLTALKQKEKEAGEARATEQALRSDVEGLRTELETAQQAVQKAGESGLAQGMEALRPTIEALQKDMEAAKAQNTGLLEELAAVKREREALQEQLQKANEELAKAQKPVVALPPPAEPVKVAPPEAAPKAPLPYQGMIFDIDGTLTRTTSPIEPAMLSLLRHFAGRRVQIALASMQGMREIRDHILAFWPMEEWPLLRYMTVYPAAGAQAYGFDVGGSPVLMEDRTRTTILRADPSRVQRVVEEAVKHLPGQRRTIEVGQRVDLEGHLTLLTVTGIDSKNRDEALKRLNQAFTSRGWPLTARIGGRHTIHVLLSGIGKGSAAAHFFKTVLEPQGMGPDRVLIVGDAFSSGGADAEMAEALPGATAVSVGREAVPGIYSSVDLVGDSGPRATQKLLERIKETGGPITSGLAFSPLLGLAMPLPWAGLSFIKQNQFLSMATLCASLGILVFLIVKKYLDSRSPTAHSNLHNVTADAVQMAVGTATGETLITTSSATKASLVAVRSTLAYRWIGPVARLLQAIRRTALSRTVAFLFASVLVFWTPSYAHPPTPPGVYQIASASDFSFQRVSDKAKRARPSNRALENYAREVFSPPLKTKPGSRAFIEYSGATEDTRFILTYLVTQLRPGNPLSELNSAAHVFYTENPNRLETGRIEIEIPEGIGSVSAIWLAAASQRNEAGEFFTDEKARIKFLGFQRDAASDAAAEGPDLWGEKATIETIPGGIRMLFSHAVTVPARATYELNITGLSSGTRFISIELIPTETDLAQRDEHGYVTSPNTVGLGPFPVTAADGGQFVVTMPDQPMSVVAYTVYALAGMDEGGAWHAAVAAKPEVAYFRPAGQLSTRLGLSHGVGTPPPSQAPAPTQVKTPVAESAPPVPASGNLPDSIPTQGSPRGSWLPSWIPSFLSDLSLDLAALCASLGIPIYLIVKKYLVSHPPQPGKLPYLRTKEEIVVLDEAWAEGKYDWVPGAGILGGYLIGGLIMAVVYWRASNLYADWWWGAELLGAPIVGMLTMGFVVWFTGCFVDRLRLREKASLFSGAYAQLNKVYESPSRQLTHQDFRSVAALYGALSQEYLEEILRSWYGAGEEKKIGRLLALQPSLLNAVCQVYAEKTGCPGSVLQAMGPEMPRLIDQGWAAPLAGFMAELKKSKANGTTLLNATLPFIVRTAPGSQGFQIALKQLELLILEYQRQGIPCTLENGANQSLTALAGDSQRWLRLAKFSQDLVRSRQNPSDYLSGLSTWISADSARDPQALADGLAVAEQLILSGIYPTRLLIETAQKTTSQGSRAGVILAWKKTVSDIKQSLLPFDPQNPIHRELEYNSFRQLAQSISQNPSYDNYQAVLQKSLAPSRATGLTRKIQLA